MPKSTVPTGELAPEILERFLQLVSNARIEIKFAVDPTKLTATCFVRDIPEHVVSHFVGIGAFRANNGVGQTFTLPLGMLRAGFLAGYESVRDARERNAREEPPPPVRLADYLPPSPTAPQRKPAKSSKR